jgi:Cytidylyltransferase-like
MFHTQNDWVAEHLGICLLDLCSRLFSRQAIYRSLAHNRSMIHTALFGTSADPPTLGHQAILEWLATQFDEVAVWAADNPFKVQQTPLYHRQTM